MQSGDPSVRRLVYASRPVNRAGTRDLESILDQARRNNGMNGVSGVLVAAKGRYVQVLEGTPEAVDHIMDAIRQDSRHTDVEVLSDQRDDSRSFGGWAMANLPGGTDETEVRQRLRRLLRNAPDAVRDAFAVLG